MDFELENKLKKELEKAGITSLTYQQLREMTDDFSMVIGRGGFGVVYKGVHKDGVVAVKILYDILDNGPFNNDLANYTRLKNHQNIIKLVAYCSEIEQVQLEHNGRLVFASKIHQALCFTYAHNGSLQEYISDESHGLDWPTRYRIIKGACEGLKHLHHGLEPAHILHLDIKPDNILLDDNMEPKLAGFDLCKFYDDERDEELTLDYLGTHGYMPPEHIKNQIISKKFDIYSLGVVMIKIVAGPQAYSRYVDMPGDEFIGLVHANWRRRLQSTFRGSTLDAYCEQVKRCTEIALLCVKEDRHERPDTVDIIHKLNETETHKGFIKDIQVWEISYKEMVRITNDFEEKIGEGAFGVVYKGKLANGKFVAVKQLNYLPSSDQIKQIRSEEHLKNIEHENIVRLVGICHEPRKEMVRKNPRELIQVDVMESLLCYEFLSNGSLEDKMWNGDTSCILDWQTRYSVIQGICKGLHYLHVGCHNAPIVHRDLKPANVLLDDHMVPKLGDFGLSRIVPKTRPHLTRAVGSCGYMAPETTRNIGSSEITPKSDIYSLGVLILEIVTGEKCDHHDVSGQQYIEKVRKYRRKQDSYVASRYPSLEDCFIQQVKNWIDIGLRCAEELPERRPTIEHIIHFLETESTNSADTREGKVTKMSLKELEDVINKFSAQRGEIIPSTESIFGAVYKGTRVNGDDIIVIKLKEHMRLSPAQFEGEVNRMSFKHNNILQLKGYCEDIINPGEVTQRLLCYEFFQGSLREIIYGGELGWQARNKITKGMCQALKYLHEECGDAPQVHMGITPTNIWLDGENVPKLGACGLSRLFANKDQTQIYNKEIVESRGYVAPEHVELSKISIKSDIYSLGVLIVEIVTGQMCPSSDNGSAASFIANVHKTWMKDLHVKSKYPSLDAEGIQQVKGCIKIGVQCADTSPDKRPTAGEIIQMLEKECTSKPGFWNALCSGVCAKA